VLRKVDSPLYESVICIHEYFFICIERIVAALNPRSNTSIQFGVGTSMEIKPIKNQDHESAEKIKPNGSSIKQTHWDR